MIPIWRCEKINESYINFVAEKSKCRFSLFITPNVCDILLMIFFMCVESVWAIPRSWKPLQRLYYVLTKEQNIIIIDLRP